MATPQDRVFTSCFHCKIKWVDKCKVRLVVQGQHMCRLAKGEDSVTAAITTVTTLQSCARRNWPSGFHTILSLATPPNLLTDHVDGFLRLSFREKYCLETAVMARCTFLHLWDMMKILSMCIAYLNDFTACPVQPELGILR